MTLKHASSTFLQIWSADFVVFSDYVARFNLLFCHLQKAKRKKVFLCFFHGFFVLSVFSFFWFFLIRRIKFLHVFVRQNILTKKWRKRIFLWFIQRTKKERDVVSFCHHQKIQNSDYQEIAHFNRSKEKMNNILLILPLDYSVSRFSSILSLCLSLSLFRPVPLRAKCN